MWDAKLPVIGSCPDCGEDISIDVRVWATNKWGERYYEESGLRRAVDRGVARYVLARHAPRCNGRARRAS